MIKKLWKFNLIIDYFLKCLSPMAGFVHHIVLEKRFLMAPKLHKFFQGKINQFIKRGRHVHG